MERFAKIVFWLQIILAWAFSVPQARQLIRNTQSITITFYLLTFLFLLFNLSLSFSSFRSERKEASKGIIWIYANWTLLVGVLLSIVLFKAVWRSADNYVLGLALVITAAVLIIGHRRNLTYYDPIIRGWLACIYKGGPQLYLVYCIWQNHGASDLSPYAVWIGDITIFLRLLQIGLAIRQSGWTRELTGLTISELGNGITWLAVTVIWLLIS